MEAQLDLFPQRKPKIGEREVAEFCAVLEQAGDWITAGRLIEEFPFQCQWLNGNSPITEDNAENFKRRLRLIAECSEDRIIGSEKGYKLLHRCTIDDLNLSTRREMKQANATIDKCQRRIRRFHAMTEAAGKLPAEHRTLNTEH
jgi:hypothetical protein